jgi:hypothetical protein
MRTNIDLNDELVAEAMRITGARTKRDVVERALAELVARSKRPSIAGLLGLGGLDPDYDHKVARGGGPWVRVEEPRGAYTPAGRTARTAVKPVKAAKKVVRKASGK